MPIIVTPIAHEAEDYGLQPDALALLWRMEERHFWHRARNRWISSALRRMDVLPGARVLEVGCGSGTVTGHLQRAGYHLTGVDTSEPQARKAHERCPEATFIVGDIARVQPPARPYDAVCFFDVLEHLDDPLRLIAAARRHAGAGTVVVATVPAQRSLQTVIDELSGHKRRYERGELARVFSDAGITDVEERGIFRLTVPLLRAARSTAKGRDGRALSTDERNRLWRDNFRIPFAPVNLALDALCALEQLSFAGARGRNGASLLATGRWPS